MTTSDWHILIGVGLFWGALLLFVVIPWLIKRRSDPKLVKDNIMIYSLSLAGFFVFAGLLCIVFSQGLVLM